MNEELGEVRSKPVLSFGRIQGRRNLRSYNHVTRILFVGLRVLLNLPRSVRPRIPLKVGVERDVKSKVYW